MDQIASQIIHAKSDMFMIKNTINCITMITYNKIYTNMKIYKKSETLKIHIQK